MTRKDEALIKAYRADALAEYAKENGKSLPEIYKELRRIADENGRYDILLLRTDAALLPANAKPSMETAFRNEAKRLRLGGHDNQAIAELLGIAPVTINQWLGPEPKRRKYRPHPKTIDEWHNPTKEELIASLEDEHMSCDDIARKYEISRATVYNKINRLKAEGLIVSRNDALICRLSKLINDEHHTSRQAANIVGIPYSNVIYYLKQARAVGINISHKPDSKTLVETYRNHTLAEIADIYHVCLSTVSNWINAATEDGYGEEIKAIAKEHLRNIGRMKRPSIEEFVEQRKQMSISELEDHYGVSTRTIKNWIRQAKANGYAEELDEIARARHGKRRYAWKCPDEKLLRQMLAEKTLDEIGRELDVPASAVAGWAKKILD